MPFLSAPPKQPSATRLHYNGSLELKFQTKVEDLLVEFGIEEFEPKVVRMLLEMEYDYIRRVLAAAKKVAKNPSALTQENLNEALRTLPRPPQSSVLVEAQECNETSELPHIEFFKMEKGDMSSWGLPPHKKWTRVTSNAAEHSSRKQTQSTATTNTTAATTTTTTSTESVGVTDRDEYEPTKGEFNIVKKSTESSRASGKRTNPPEAFESASKRQAR